MAVHPVGCSILSITTAPYDPKTANAFPACCNPGAAFLPRADRLRGTKV
ncbi:MAG: hypothetical protein IKA41_00205 [Bacteroidaceae bacterium]|nr:hypothetical protein [Bacteroidaceae bacterium]